MELSGILNLNKPAGLSSTSALTRIKAVFPRDQRPKIGHAGTLDPFATGVLLVLFGRATRQCEQLMGQPKCYRATIKLGGTTTTLDPTSSEEPTPLPRRSASEWLQEVERVLPQFVGVIQQTPPAFSALKISGRPAYRLARRGQPVALAPRPVTIYSIQLMSLELPLLELDIRCGRGTYVRSLARDIARALGTGGYLTALQRNAIGPFTLEDSVKLDSVQFDTIRDKLIRADVF